eukprot:CAMPEP_0204592616 /NCGR_PEP_ID=MMETSP0661-20131031/51030_1 /ASSEMBLY_ACC=CAM_ASM_000606 /TAXON_ID=109239 /ORGANISM="Alexandrium margalefi, Strain AMGDE01CS-322" /LENGTH=336 /DNA_ID=CAMNT_0051602853 /DNA_START=41 /DNA_END=1051 /DNA_ORIENTATION=+
MLRHVAVSLACAFVTVHAIDSRSAPSGSPIDACPRLTPRAPPSHIGNLKPMDVKVLGAMGDSFTAGFAIHGTPVEDREETYSTGDKAGATTIANFLRHYGNRVAVHNVAVSGDVVQGMDKQANRLIAAIRDDKSIDFRNDWKIVTILIGGNNQCAACHGAAANQPTMYREDLTSALTILRKALPRTVVSLVSMVNLSSLVDRPGVDEHCKIQHIIGEAECTCPFLGANASADVQRVTEADNAYLFEIAMDFQSKEFSVVVQPGMDMMAVPDWTYLSRWDCFHPALITHQQVALGLWTNLFQPVGNKTTRFNLPVRVYCPTDDDLIHTSVGAGIFVV